MAEDPYKLLGVEKTASAEDIRKAYRKLAKQYHPDLNPGNKAAEEKFKAVSAANELLSDPDKRARFDRGEIDESGTEKPPPRSYRHYADAGAGERYRYGGGAEPGGDFEDIFSTIFADRRGGGGAKMRGRDTQYRLDAPFLDAITGATQRLTLPDGATLDVKIPPGTETGDVLRLRGRGTPGPGDAPAGDALIEITVAPHPFFSRDGQDLRLDLPVTLREAVLGAKITVPTPGGPVAMTVKPGADTGTEMRLRGRGVPGRAGQTAGDLYVRLKLVAGPPDEALATFLRAHEPPPFNPRAAMESGA